MTDDDEKAYQQMRETWLVVMLGGLGLFGFLFFLALITGGFFIWVYLVVGAIALLALGHYLLWGWSMTQATSGEREEEEFRARMEEEDWPEVDPRHPRRD